MDIRTKKLKSTAGFTLAEVLIAVVILVMITATALPAAMKAYQNAVDAANAQVLLSNTVDALRGELSTAWDVKVDNANNTITYKSSATGGVSVLSIVDHVIMLQEYQPEADAGWWDAATDKTTVPIRPLVSEAMRRTTGNGGKLMVAEYEGAELSDNEEYVIIKQLTIQRGGKVIASMPKETDLMIRIMTKTK